MASAAKRKRGAKSQPKRRAESQPARPAGPAAAPVRRSGEPSLEWSILHTATLCLLALGAVMVYSASSAESLIDSGDSSHFLKRYVLYALVGLAVMHVLSNAGPSFARRVTPILLVVAFALTIAVMIPGVGVEVNGATRWLGAGPVRFQPSELLKLSLVLYAAQVLARRPAAVRTFGGLCKPVLLVVGAACALLLAQPDMGTALMICASIGTLLVAAGARKRHLLALGGLLAIAASFAAWVEPYRRERLTSFIDPWQHAGDSGFQAVQAMVAIGSGGPFGVGLGESVQKVFYLPEAHTDMILAIIGEELGVVGIAVVVGLYGLIGYAGLRTAKLARDRHAKLLAAGVTSLILCQATLNLFAVMGMAPLTGVPLPFISFGNSNLIVLLGAMGMLLGAAGRGRARGAARGGRAGASSGARGVATGGSGARRPLLQAIEGGLGRAPRPDSRGRDGGSRRAGARGRGRAAG